MRRRTFSTSASLLKIPFAIALLSVSMTAEAQYVGLEPERLNRLITSGSDTAEALAEQLSSIEAEFGFSPDARLWLRKGSVLAALGRWQEASKAFRRASDDLPKARLGLAVSLLRLGKREEALDAIGESVQADDDHLYRYGWVLLRLQADNEVRFEELRRELQSILRSEPQIRETFELWLALNPVEEEIETLMEFLKSRTDAVAHLQRAEALLRLGEPEQALTESRKIRGLAGEMLNRIEWIRARAHFQLNSDVAGQALYWRILDRLDPVTADLLFRDLGSIATLSEREEYEALTLEEKGDFFRRFWIKRDPAPTEQANPRLAEHHRRLAVAQLEYPLQSTGNGYFTDESSFLSLSPRLPYFDSTAVLASGAASRFWLDHRGLMLIRHGEPDFRVAPRRYGHAEESESWRISRFQARPMFFHFIRRPSVGEWTLALNLGVAAARHSVPDDPVQVANSLTSSFRPLYQSRLRLNSLYSQILGVRSRRDLERFLTTESQIGASLVSAALGFDSTNYYTQDNTLPLAVSATNYYQEGQPAVLVSFATDLGAIAPEELSPNSKLQATLLLYDQKWLEIRTRVEKEFPLWPLPKRESKVLFGVVQLADLRPEDYRLVLQVQQPETNRRGIARGRHAVEYVHPGNLGLSDLFLFQQPKSKDSETKADRAAGWLPVPTRVMSQEQVARIDFELYNLGTDDAGRSRYEVEERLLTLYKDPGVLGQIAGYANLAGQMLFPLYTFVGQVGAFTLSQALASETAGLEVHTRTVEKPASPVVHEKLEMSLEELDKGVYTVYVTVRDLESGGISSRFLTLQIT